MKRVILLFALALTLSACGFNQGRYQQKNDSTPVRKPTAAELHDAIPRLEKPSRGGNRTYTVFGKSYQVLKNSDSFEQTGTASWYGNKFHGHLTSNGEIYDMYSMSAAHKNLPLPTYVKVTNLANNKSTIVRVNDRGPFHQDRIIDLSYSAAYKLDILKTGTAKVHIQAITELPTKAQNTTVAKTLNTIVSPSKNTAVKIFKETTSSPYYIQVFATKSINTAKATSNKLSQAVGYPATYPYRDGIFRIFVGPIPQQTAQNDLLLQLQKLGYPSAYIKNKIN